MKLKTWFATALLVLCSALAIADDKKKPKAMSAEEKAMMEAWAKAATPGDAHKLLNAMVGTWNAKVSFWSPGSSDPMTSSGSATNRWILGGRYLEQKFAGSYMGQPFNGIGYTGYDNLKQQYFGTWMDSMSTGIMASTGSTSDKGKTWEFTATATDPMTGKEMTMKEKMVVVDRNKHTFEMWSPGPDGTLYKAMEIVYTRKKS